MASTPPDKSSDYASQLYMHSFDDVYQATAEAIERKGWFIDSADKSAGTYVFSEKNGFNFTAVVKIEPINSSGSPQARVRFNYIKKPGGLGGLEFRSRYPKMFFTELQKILATYR